MDAAGFVATMAALTMIDRAEGNFADVHLMVDCAFAARMMTENEMHQLEPSVYKNVIENPTTFQEAWNHPSLFQPQLWREATQKELKQME